MNIKFYLILLTFCTNACLQASQAAQKEGARHQKQATSLESLMIFYARYGHLTKEKLQQYLKQGADINARDADGCPALVLAAEDGHTVVVQLLIAAGADTNAQDNDGDNALILATLYCHDIIIQLLIAADANLDAQDKNGQTALIKAISYSDISYDHKDVIQLLIAAGANLNTQDIAGYTALMRATVNSSWNTAQLLIAAGADPYIRNKQNNNHRARDYARDKDVYDQAVTAGLAEWDKKQAEYRARQPHAKTIVAEQATHIPGLQDIIMGYAYGPSPLDLPPDEEKKSDDSAKK